MAESRQQILKKAVFRLIECSQSQKEVFSEVNKLRLNPEELANKSSYPPKWPNRTIIISLKNAFGESRPQLLSDIAEAGYLSLLDQTSSHTTRKKYYVNECLKNLVNVCNSSQGQKLTAKQKDELDTLINILKIAKVSGSFNLSSITETLITDTPCHLEVWMALHRHGIVPLQHFVQLSEKTHNFVQSFSRQILDLGKIADETVLLSDVLAALVNIGSSTYQNEDDSSKGPVQTCIAVIENLIRDILDKILKKEYTEVGPVIHALCALSVSTDVQRSFFSHVFSLIMGHKPEMKVSKAVREQGQWVIGKIAEELVMLYKQVLIVLDMTKILSFVQQILAQQEVNWQLFLSFISVATVVIQESQKYILDFTDNLLQEGLEEGSLETTITGLLIVRQACLQGPHVFMSYANWFERTFSDNSKSFANSRKSFTFFMKLLTDLTPYESAQHIKVHILRPPHVPGKCRQILTDYIMLAKTRLQDLQEPLETQATGDTKDQNKTTDGFEEEVNNAVEAFQASGKIPTSVLEASIFRKPYYIGHFLPALLKPRPLPDIPDMKMKLIGALKKADKIPASMYQKYEKECKKEAMQLLDGVFEDLDSDEDMELSPLDQLKSSLQHLMTLVSGNKLAEEKPKHTLKEVVSVIASKVEGCLSELPVSNIDQTPIVINIKDIHIQNNYNQVVDIILNGVNTAVQVTVATGSFDFTWLKKLVEALLPYWKLREALFKRVFILLVVQGPNLQEYHIDTLATLCVEIYLVEMQTPSWIQCECLKGNNSLLEFICLHLSCGSGNQMLRTFRFVTSCLKHLYTSHVDQTRLISVPFLMKKFIHLSTRLVPDCRFADIASECLRDSTQTANVVMMLYKSEFLQTLLKITQLSLQDWLERELQIDVTDDVLNDFERFDYYQWFIYHHYLGKTDGRCDKYMEAASVILNTLLTYNERFCNIGHDLSLVRTDCVKKGTEIGMIQLLIGLTQLFHKANAPTDSRSWLTNQLTRILETRDTDIARQNVVIKSARLIMCLPPYLLFSDEPRTLTLNSGTVQESLDFINSVFVTHLSEGLILPVSFTAYLAQGLLQAIGLDGHRGMMDLVVEKCPALIIAFVVNYQAVQPYLDMLVDDDESELQRFFSKLRRNEEHITENYWLSACAIFSQILNQSHRQCLQQIFNENNFKDSAAYQNVMFHATDMMFLQLTYLQQFSHIKNQFHIDKVHTALRQVIESNTKKGLLDHVLLEVVGNRTTLCANSQLLKLYPLTVIRFLRDENMDTVGKYLSIEGSNGLLRFYICMCKLYEEQNMINTKQVVAIDEVSNTCKFIVSVIGRIHVEILKSVDKDITMKCGSPITDAVLRRL